MREQGRLKTCLLVAALASTLTAMPVPAASGRGTGTLAMKAELRITSQLTACPPGTPSGVHCGERKGNGVARGLGSVTEYYFYLVDQEAAECGGGKRVLRTTARLTIAGKGELEVALEEHPTCFPNEVLNLSRTYRVTGGDGAYSGATGTGTIVHRLAPSGTGSDSY